MLFHNSFLEILLCYKVPTQTVKVKIEVEKVKLKKTDFKTFKK